MWKIVKILVLVLVVGAVIAVLGDDELRASIKNCCSDATDGAEQN